MKNVSELNDEDLLDEYDNTRRSLSFYNAAEGEMWYIETKHREKTKTYLNALKKELEVRKLKSRMIEFLC